MAFSAKRPLAGGDDSRAGALVPAKRSRHELVPVASSSDQQKRGALIPAGPPRSSSLDAPIMQLTGHGGEIFSAKFSPTGATLASGSYDRLIYLWKVYGECENYCVMKGHSGAIMEIQYSTDGSLLYSASTDKTAAVWDLEVGVRIKKLRGHTSIVNSCGPSRRGQQMLATGSDDGTIKLWDLHSRYPAQSFTSVYQVTSVCYNDTGDLIISGGLDNNIMVWDRRNEDKPLYTLSGHNDTVTGISVSPDGSYLLSNGMDNTVRVWDIRPFAPHERQLKVLFGVQHNFEKNLLRCCWSPDGRKLAAGSADRFVYVWDSVTGYIIYKLPGHRGSVNDVCFHPDEPILLSCSSDKTIFLGELQ